MTSAAQKIFERPAFLRRYEKRVHGRFLSSFAHQKMNYESIYSDLLALAPRPASAGRGPKDAPPANPIADPPASPPVSPPAKALIVDLGCGTGWFARRLATDPALAESAIVGLDVSPAAIEVARELARSVPKPHAALRFAVANAEDLAEHTAEPAAEIWLCGALHQMSRPELALEQVAGALGPDGVMYCQTFCENPDLVARVDIKVLSWFGHRVFARGELDAMAEKAGLVIVAEQLRGLVLLAAFKRRRHS
jgi:SAM-dependent methyltransferase